MVLSVLSRRRVLETGAALGAAAPLIPHLTLRRPSWRTSERADPPEAANGPAYRFFTEAEALFVEAACERIVPADELGPGAKAAGAPAVIDRRLDGPYGRGERWYMRGPWAKGTESQGWQSRHGPAGLYRAAIAAIDRRVRLDFRNRPFHDLRGDDQDEVLASLEAGRLDLGGVEGRLFFETLLENVFEALGSDLPHGGALGAAGWTRA
jgi:gluconate 2-dehydrogenase gamma chain